jgi:D-beta-D-heptose 7-phosphate kinase/D-beta-D-heptose 1-phosphate adenosyltransferase
VGTVKNVSPTQIGYGYKEKGKMEKYARIVNFEEFDQIRDQLGRIVCTSGGFDPIHPGHASCIVESKQYGDTLVVVVNGDGFLQRKKGKPFMDLETRCHIVSFLRGVDYVIPYETDGDQTVSGALRLIRPHVFTKGGDRVDRTSIPEWQVCQELGIELISGVGKPKLWSSSDFLKEWGEFWYERSNQQALLKRQAEERLALPIAASLALEPRRNEEREISRRRKQRLPQPGSSVSRHR